MMTFEQVMTVVIGVAPAVSAIIGIVVAVLKNKSIVSGVITKFEELRHEVINTKEYEDLKAELKIAHQENRELKKKFNELLTKIDRVVRDEE